MKVCGCCLHEQNIRKQKGEVGSPAMHISASRSRAANALAAKAVAQQHRRGQQLRKYFQHLYSESGRRERLPYAPTPRYFRPKPRTRKSPSRLSLPVTSQPEPTGGCHRLARSRRHNPRIPPQMKPPPPPPYHYDSQSDLETRKEIQKTCRELNEMLARTERLQKRPPQRRRREYTKKETISFNPELNKCPKMYPKNSLHETTTLFKKNSNPYYQSHRHHNHHPKPASLLGFNFDSNCLLAEMTNDLKSSSSLLSHPLGQGQGHGVGAGDAEETSRSPSPMPSPTPTPSPTLTEAELTTTPSPGEETLGQRQRQPHRKQPNQISNVAPQVAMAKISSNPQFGAPHSWPETTPRGTTMAWKKSAATSPLCPAAELNKQPEQSGSFAATPPSTKNPPVIKSEGQFFSADVLFKELTRPPSGFLRRWCSGDDGQLQCSKGCEVHCPKETIKNGSETNATPPRESRSKFISIIENAIGENSNRKEVKKRKSRRHQRSSDFVSLDRQASQLQKYKGLETVAQAVQKTESNPLITDTERRLCSTITLLLETHQRHNKIASDLSSCTTTSVEHGGAATSGDFTPTNNTVPNSRRYLEQLRRLRCDHLRHIKREIRQLESLERFLHPGHFFKDIT